jgi:hypothetical protein
MKCDILPNLQKHVRAFHQRIFSTQTMEKIIHDKKKEDKQKASCFFCDYKILDEQHLIENKLKCHRKSYSTGFSTLPTHSKAFFFPVAFLQHKLSHVITQIGSPS